MALSALFAAAVLSASPAVPMPACPNPTASSGTVTVAASDGPDVRAAAQKGLGYLSKATLQWQEQNQCFGCHVQAVTLEAFAVGSHHQYEVRKKTMDEVVNGMLRLPGGARREHGLSYHDDSLFEPAKAFGGAAFARYDQWVGSAVRDDLWKVAKELLKFQQEDGSVTDGGWVNLPVGAGRIQTTYQAMQTWRQTYSRTADDLWLAPLRKAEKFIRSQATAGDRSLQDTNYALMALLSAGASPTDPLVRALEKRVLARQQEDGSWSLEDGSKSAPAFATGQSLYALRMMGRTDRDSSVARGTRWLLKNQLESGAWSEGGFGKAEAMWGVLGLVSVDVLTVAVTGAEDGQRIDGTTALKVTAKDNQGGGVKQVELLVDDLRVAGACGATLEHAIDAAALGTGKHIVEAVALNARGERSVRRLELFSGSVFLTELGSQFVDEGTTLALRDIALPSEKGLVRLSIRNDRHEELFRQEQPSVPGPLSFRWTGKSTDGKAQPRGKYVAMVAFVDPSGAVKQELELVFAHETIERQRATHAEVQGQLNLGAGMGAATNAPVELVDNEGNVVQRTTSTASGQYRFKNVDPGQYKVRVQGKAGFKKLEADVRADKGKESEVSADLQAE